MDSDDYEEKKNNYLSRKGIKTDQPDSPDYDDLKQKYLERKGFKIDIANDQTSEGLVK